MATKRRLRGKPVDYTDQLFVNSESKGKKRARDEAEKENQPAITTKGKATQVKRRKQPKSDSESEAANEILDTPEPKRGTRAKRKPFGNRTNEDSVEEEKENQPAEPNGISFEQESELTKAKIICSTVKKRLSKPMFSSDIESDADVDNSIDGTTPGAKPDPVPYKDEYENLLRKYRELKELRTTKAEELYAQHKVNAEKREKALQSFVEQNKKEVERLNKRLQKSHELTKELEAKQEKAEADVVQLTKIVAFYECMSRVHVVPQDNNRFYCSCSSSNGREATFYMGMGEGNFEYEPVKVGDESGQWAVPPYLEKTIYFADREGPKWFAKLLASLYH